MHQRIAIVHKGTGNIHAIFSGQKHQMKNQGAIDGHDRIDLADHPQVTNPHNHRFDRKSGTFIKHSEGVK